MAASDGGYAGVPVDGWTQLIVYRKDLFDANGLAAPTSYANVIAAMEALEGQVDYGFIAPNKVDEGFMSQVFRARIASERRKPSGHGLAWTFKRPRKRFSSTRRLLTRPQKVNCTGSNLVKVTSLDKPQ